VRRPCLCMVRSSLISALLLSGAMGRAAGQSDPAGVVSRIRPGAVIRARLTSEQTVTGRYVPIGDGRLGITAEPGMTDTVRLSQLRQLAVRGRHTKTGAIIGGAGGAAFGVFVGILVTALCETDSCNGTRPYLIAVPVFGAAGALLGGAVGAAFPKWRTVFP